MENQSQVENQSKIISTEVVESSEPNVGVKLSNVLAVSGVIIALIIIVFGLSQTIHRGQNIQPAIIYYFVSAAVIFAGFYAPSVVIRLLVDIKLELREMNGKSNQVSIAAYAEETDDENE
jgi:hypothetical protein